jgi:putative transposase
MDEPPHFGTFDKNADIGFDSRFLPHWFQPGVAVFITFRTADSLPREVIMRWKDELRDWLRRAGVMIEPDQELPDVEMIPGNLQSEYSKFRDRLWHWHLDSCHGECVLRQRELAELVKSSLLHFNGERYHLASLIVMPNHVHLIAQFNLPTLCRKQCTSWMHYSAREINRELNRTGEFWQSEPFDHLIRSDAQFQYLQSYIADNGRKANLPPSDYLHWTYET